MSQNTPIRQWDKHCHQYSY